MKNLGYCIFVTNGICQTFNILLMYPSEMKAVLTELKKKPKNNLNVSKCMN